MSLNFDSYFSRTEFPGKIVFFFFNKSHLKSLNFHNFNKRHEKSLNFHLDVSRTIS